MKRADREFNKKAIAKCFSECGHCFCGEVEVINGVEWWLCCNCPQKRTGLIKIKPQPTTQRR